MLKHNATGHWAQKHKRRKSFVRQRKWSNGPDMCQGLRLNSDFKF